MEGSTMVRMERKSSIENEPRTLNNNQMQFAREAAQYVANTRSNEEALSIFMEGLEPVVSGGGGWQNGNGRRRRRRRRRRIDTGKDFLGGCSDVNELRIPGPRDTASAPF